MSDRPWMPLYIGDYLSKTSHLRAAQSGAYLHLLMHYWQHESLPDDDEQLSTIARMELSEWQKCRPVIQRFFSDGWKHKRADEELAKANKIIESRQESGRRGGLQRAANAKQVLEQKPKQTPKQNPTPSQSQSHEGSKSPSGHSPRSLSKIIFDEIVPILTENAGMNDRSARSLIGKWRGQLGDAALVSVITEAQQKEISDFVAWVEAVIRRRKNGAPINGNPAKQAWTDTLDRIDAALDSAGGQGREENVVRLIPQWDTARS